MIESAGSQTPPRHDLLFLSTVVVLNKVEKHGHALDVDIVAFL